MGDALIITCTTGFGWLDRLRILLGCELHQRITVRTELPEIGPHTIETVAEVEPLIRPRAPGPQTLAPGPDVR
jgi:hypothetical protein